jgi:DNA-binding protein H-NS
MAEIKKLQSQADEMRASERPEALTRARELVQSYSLTARELGLGVGPSPQLLGSPLKGRTVAPKYRGPDGQTWTGRGVPPKWLSEELAKGRSKDDFLIPLRRSREPSPLDPRESRPESPRRYPKSARRRK